jgi:hypothetical protein
MRSIQPRIRAIHALISIRYPVFSRDRAWNIFSVIIEGDRASKAKTTMHMATTAHTYLQLFL